MTAKSLLVNLDGAQAPFLAAYLFFMTSHKGTIASLWLIYAAIVSVKCLAVWVLYKNHPHWNTSLMPANVVFFIMVEVIGLLFC